MLLCLDVGGICLCVCFMLEGVRVHICFHMKKFLSVILQKMFPEHPEVF